MRAAVVHQPGATPVLEQFSDPRPGPGVSVGTLVAAALNPLDVAFVNDHFPLRRLQPPCVAGYEGVVQLADGTRVGHSLLATPAEERRSAYAQLAGHALDGKLSVDLEQTRLEDISQTWEHLKAGAPRKLVVTP